ncbi:MAG: sugar ABC transporter substrate-binding protein [Treponema sp.]|jgi:ribose transport system substrate-binding protein|nr:sugar ABC transporter substrate-binding protein [Treponema sp.]
MKKIIITMLAALMLFAGVEVFAGGESQQGAKSGVPSGKAKTVAYLTFTAEGDYWNSVYDEMRRALNKLGYEMDLINANNNLATQIEQIENSVVKGYAGIFIIPVDPSGVADATKRAVAAGTPVLAFIKNPGPGNVTAFLGSNEAYLGELIVGTASTWAKERWPGKNGIKVLIVGGNSTGSETERYEAMVAEATKNPQFTIVDTVRWETSQAASMQAAENVLVQYKGDINIMIVGSGEMALGCRQAVMATGSPITNYADFGIFTGDISEEVAKAIRASKTNKDVLRMAVVNGGDRVKSSAEFAQVMIDCINDTNSKTEYYVTIDIATPDNLADFGYSLP